MSDIANLVAALTAAGAPFVGVDNATELARNLAVPVADPEECIEAAVEQAIEARRVPRKGGWLLTDAVNVAGLTDALIEVSLEWWSSLDLGGDESEPDDYEAPALQAQGAFA